MISGVEKKTWITVKTFVQMWPSDELQSSQGALHGAGGGYRAEAHFSSSRSLNGSQHTARMQPAPLPPHPLHSDAPAESVPGVWEVGQETDSGRLG